MLKSYSKEGQDRLVRALVKKAGFFLDIGCGHPINANNTFMLEKLGWNGILIDRNEQDVSLCKQARKASAFCMDVGKINWLRLLNNSPKVIDYISADVDDSNIDFVQNFPFDQYEFKLMTFETDCYIRGNKIKDVSDKVLSQYPCYKLLLENATLGKKGIVWEDWWVNEKYIDCKHLYAKNIHWLDFIENLEQVYWKLFL